MVTLSYLGFIRYKRYLVLKSGYGEAGVMALKVVYRVLPEAVTEVKEIVPVALIFLLSDGNQVIGEYPDLS
jgi:hypothetical protein